ncbi:beta-ketoadipate enol-lactone hydrolase [alpha proteobacterium U9-1i]|nr:beta-ketoadipate enol-lactone hydrolase [alpha proteobacterium U9-1i]
MSEKLQQTSVRTRLGAVHVTRAGAGAPLMLLHGNGHSWREFEATFEALANSFDVIAWDMPGQGKSDDVSADTSIADYAGAFADVVSALDLKWPAILGSSVGAFIAAEYALTHDNVSALILDEMQFRGPEFWSAAWPVVEKMFGNTNQAGEQVQARFTRALDAEFIAHWNASLQCVGAERLIGVMRTLAAFDVRANLPRITQPTLLLFGANGPTVEMASAMHAAMPNADLRVIENAGHFISIDQPAQFADAVTAFVRASPQRRA